MSGAQGRLPPKEAFTLPALSRESRSINRVSNCIFRSGPKEWDRPAKETAMTNAIHELKIRAEILHKRIKVRDHCAVARLRVLTAFRRRSDEDLAAIAMEIRRHDCLTVIAAELGFPNWTQAKRVLTGDGEIMDFGTLLCPPTLGGGHINRWYARYDEAATARET